MIRGPPRSTLFPNTTLCRSHDRHGLHHAPLHDPAAPRHAPGDRPGDVAGGVAVRRDRKCTRLNSSHANISYAVFCLIKNHPPLLVYPLAFDLCTSVAHTPAS